MPKLLTKNRIDLDKSRKDLVPSVYSTRNSAFIRINSEKLYKTLNTFPVGSLHLKISKVWNKFMFQVTE